MLPPKQEPIRISVPFMLDEDVGLGDVVKWVTTKIGVRPCEPCQARATAMNCMIVFSGRRAQPR